MCRFYCVDMLYHIVDKIHICVLKKITRRINVTIQYKRCMHLSIMIVFMDFIVTSISGLYQYE